MQNIMDSIECPCRPGLNTPGTTNLTGAFRHARLNIFTPDGGDRSFARNVLIVFTDGNDNVEQNGLLEEVRLHKARGWRIMTVGITNEIDENELRDISTLTTDFIKVEEFFLLTNELNNLISQVKTDEM